MVSSSIFRVYTMNAVTEKQLFNRLQYICDQEDARVNALVIDSIVKSSNRDVRNSLLTLGLQLLPREEKAKAKGKRKKIDAADSAGYAKDGTLGIFHGVGKFLYNKSIIDAVESSRNRPGGRDHDPTVRPRGGPL